MKTDASSDHRHIFISYASRDAAFVTTLKDTLDKADVKYWIDKEDLRAGEPNWEAAIRAAIRDARLVLYIASPAANASNYVHAELLIAERESCPIFAVFADGDNWVDAAPMKLLKMQYIDLRGEQYAANLPRMLGALMGAGDSRAERIRPLPIEAKALPEPRNPYKALEAFTGADKGDFFGRDDLISALVERLKRFPAFLALVGASGAGKSSVMMAGLLPRLQEGAVPGSDRWVYLPPIKPDRHPLEALASALTGVFHERSINSLLDDLNTKSTRGLHQLASAVSRPPKARVVLLIDQFEELFTQTDDLNERSQFVNLLMTSVSEANSPLTVLVTLRADFYDRPLHYAEFGALLNTHHEPILPMSLRDLQAVIERPAALPGVQVTFEEGLVSELVFETRDEVGGLPLLQFTLDLLFQKRSGRTLTWQAYREQIGGLRGALRTHAEATYQALPSDDARRMAKALFLRLLEPGATEQDTTRRRARLSELTGAEHGQTEQMRQVVDTFVAARLLTADKTTIEVSHEALIREWPRLGDWLRESRDDVRLQQDLSSDAAEWVKRGQPADRLYRGLVLDEALAWKARNVSSAEELAFLDAAVKERTRQADEAREQQARELELARRAEAAERDRAVRFQRAARIAATIAALAVIGVIAGVVGIVSATEQTNRANNQLGTATVAQGNAIATGVAVEALVTLAVLERAEIEMSVAGVGQVPMTVVPTLSLNQRVATATTRAQLYLKATTTPPQRFDGVEMALVPAGCFQMGSAAGDSNEGPVHWVCFGKPYWIDRYEVTNLLYSEFINAGGYTTENYWTPDGWQWVKTNDRAGPRNWEGFVGRQQPRVGVTWYEAYAYCSWRNVRLPTEAEWEYAARGPQSLVYPWGNTYEQGRANILNTRNSTTDVGSYPGGVSWVGAFDLSGNVWEWVADWYDETYYTRSPKNDPDGASSGKYHVPRGGSWDDRADNARAAYRGWDVPDVEYVRFGVRCARSFE